SVLGTAQAAEIAVLLPQYAAWDPPGRINAGTVHARSLATARAATASEMLVVCGTESEPWVLTMAMTISQVRAVRGIDPDAGFHEVRVQGSAAGATRLDPVA